MDKSDGYDEHGKPSVGMGSIPYTPGALEKARSQVCYMMTGSGAPAGLFVARLINAIFVADSDNLDKLYLGFPQYVDAVRLYQTGELHKSVECKHEHTAHGHCLDCQRKVTAGHALKGERGKMSEKRFHIAETDYGYIVWAHWKYPDSLSGVTYENVFKNLADLQSWIKEFLDATTPKVLWRLDNEDRIMDDKERNAEDPQVKIVMVQHADGTQEIDPELKQQ
jgi:hypothetical protein